MRRPLPRPDFLLNKMNAALTQKVMKILKNLKLKKQMLTWLLLKLPKKTKVKKNFLLVALIQTLRKMTSEQCLSPSEL